MKTTLLALSILFLACTAEAAEPCERLKPGLLVGDVYAVMDYLDTTNQDYIAVANDGGVQDQMPLYPEGGIGDLAGTPAWVYVQFGARDSIAGSDPQYIVDHLFELAGYVEASLPGIPVYVGTIPPIKGLTGRKLRLWERTNQLIIERGGLDFPTYTDLAVVISQDTGCADPGSAH